MAKEKTDTAKIIKKVQELDDDDTSLDITQRKRLHYTKKDINQHKNKMDLEAEKEYESKDNSTTKNLYLLLAAIAIIFIIFTLVITFYKPTKHVATIDELHEANLAGKLKPADGYVYNGYSFINFAGVWYSRLQKGNSIYDVTFNNGPRDVENITVEGSLTSDFVKDNHIHITFDPTGQYLQYIAVANYGLSRSLAWAFSYNMTAACTKNVTTACINAGVVQCGDPDKAVIYFKEDPETKVVLNSTCVTVQGHGPEIVRGKDRLLMRWYGMMD